MYFSVRSGRSVSGIVGKGGSASVPDVSEHSGDTEEATDIDISSLLLAAGLGAGGFGDDNRLNLSKSTTGLRRKYGANTSKGNFY
jgi:phage repressor protein C with HTH and peptisase S24 domain